MLIFISFCLLVFFLNGFAASKTEFAREAIDLRVNQLLNGNQRNSVGQLFLGAKASRPQCLRRGT